MYESNAKQTFGRGWAINRIIERLEVQPHDARIVALAGEDNDRQWLIRRGFKNHNIISIDRDADAVAYVRKNGGVAIHASISEALRCWPDDWPIHGMLLDFNCGFDESVVLTLSALCAKPFRAATCYLNLQRGRDWAGRIFSKTGQWPSRLNRAHIALSTWVHAQVLGAPDAYKFSDNQRQQLVESLYAELKAIGATSYRQKEGGVMMDGCVFTVPEETLEQSIKSTDLSLTRKVIAARAVSTRLRNLAA